MYLGRQTTAKGKHQQLICGCIDGAIPTTKTLVFFLLYSTQTEIFNIDTF